MALSTSLFDYHLPEELIAQYPADRRDGSRMMVLDPESGDTEIRPFSDIVNYLHSGDRMVCNNTKVLRGRMFGLKNGDPAGARFELLLIARLDPAGRRWSALLRPGKRARAGTMVVLLDGDGKLNAAGDGFTVLGRCSSDPDAFEIEFNSPDCERLQNAYGHIPLPPYIRREDATADATRYQTLFAREAGAVAAPTAGLHFSEEVLAELAGKGIARSEVTLHVGPGTFKTVSVEDVSLHKMHQEEYFLSPESAEAINATRRSGGRILAVGTTTVRVLESCAAEDGTLTPGHGHTGIFLYPPYQVRACDLLLTNFHLPKSTLLMLVSCFVDREKMLAAYATAIREKMRFYSYGDCMLILPRRPEAR